VKSLISPSSPVLLFSKNATLQMMRRHGLTWQPLTSSPFSKKPMSKKSEPPWKRLSEGFV